MFHNLGKGSGIIVHVHNTQGQNIFGFKNVKLGMSLHGMVILWGKLISSSGERWTEAHRLVCKRGVGRMLGRQKDG